ncbi:MAG: glycosyltransferase 87 family protein [Candidatus Dormibacteria bacterium]
MNAVIRQWRELCVIAITAALVGSYVGHVASLAPRSRATTDFSSTYVGATIVRLGEAQRIYDLSLQASIGNRLLAPDPLVFPFEVVALGALSAAPLTLLSVSDAFDVWAALQLLLVVGAVAVVVREARRRSRVTRLAALAMVGIGVAAAGTGNLIAVGQWPGFNALGVAMAYRCWSRGRHASGAAWIVGTAALAKPHLAIGLLVFIGAWGNRRALLGAGAAIAAAAAAFVGLVGIAGAAAFVHGAVQSNVVSSERGGAGILALPSTWFNDGLLTYPVGFAAAALLLVACAVIGRRVHHNPALLSAGFAAATVLSVLVSPHAFLYDDVMIAPAVAWSLVELGLFSRGHRRSLANPWTIVVLWLAVPLVQFTFTAQMTPVVLRVGELFVWSTLLLAVTLWTLGRDRYASTWSASRAPTSTAMLPTG